MDDPFDFHPPHPFPRPAAARASGPLRVALSASLLLTLAACTAVGYPAPSPPPTPAAESAGGGAEPGATAGRTSTPAEVRAEPLSRYGNPDSYEVFGRTYRVLDTADGYVADGVASWYGEEFAGRPTSTGEPYDPEGMTAAHRTLPLPSWVEVIHRETGRRVVVRVNDRGPFSDPGRRIIDLSRAAARELGILGAGLAPVTVRVLAGPLPPVQEEGPR